MMSAYDQYALGRSPKEYARLARQAEIMKPMTLRLFSEAGIRPGMNVLDLGSGAGDVAMLLAEMVGPSGSVIGLDLDHDATLHAQERTIAAQIPQRCVCSFRLRGLPSRCAPGCDRWTSGAHVPRGPAAALARLIKYLVPGGVVAFIDHRMLIHSIHPIQQNQSS